MAEKLKKQKHKEAKDMPGMMKGPKVKNPGELFKRLMKYILKNYKSKKA